MRVMNLMIVLAIIAIVILGAQYISQLRKNRNGNTFVSGGRVFLNWTLVAVLVICIGGIAFESVHSHHQEAKSAQTSKPEDVEYTASNNDNLGEVSVQFDKKVKMDDNGEAKVKFKVSPQTTLTIQGHKSKEIVKIFKASKDQSLVKHSYTFDVAGTYDIIAERDGHKVTKRLKVEANDDVDNSSSDSSSVSSSSSSVASSSSSVASSSQSSSATSTTQSSSASRSSTATSNNSGNLPSRNNYRAPHYSGSTGSNHHAATAPVTENKDTGGDTTENDGYVTEGPQY